MEIVRYLVEEKADIGVSIEIECILSSVAINSNVLFAPPSLSP